MMQAKDWFFSFIEAVSWVGFFYILLYSIKHDINLLHAAIMLVALLYVAGLSCPFVRFSNSWQRMWKK